MRGRGWQRHQHRHWLVLPLVAGVLALTGCSSAGNLLPGQPGSTPTPAPAAPGPSVFNPPPANPADGYKPAQQLTLSGLANGQVTSAEVDCSQVGPSTYAWILTGQLGGSELELSFNTNKFQGPGTYRVSGISEAGVMTMTLGGQTAATDAVHDGTFTVDPDGETGSMDVELSSPQGTQRVRGTWSCTDN